MSKDLRNGGIVAAIALAILLIGAATDNALLMFGMSVAALIAITALYWPRIRGRAMLLALAAAVVSAATSAGILAAVR
jgi:hypothetical protein